MNKSFIFVAVSSLLGMAAINFGSTLTDVYAAKPDPNFGNNPTQDCDNEPYSLSASCCWTEEGEEGIGLTYCQYCFINTDTGEFENCSDVKQYRGLPNFTAPQEPEGLKDDGTTTPQKPKFPGAMTGLDPELLAPTNDTNNTNVKKYLGGDAKLPQTGGKVLEPSNIAPVGINVVTVVTFNSITVHNKHEGFASGDGEYKLAAYVQGKKVGLTYASGPGAGLMDVSNGETLIFKRSNVAITEIPNNIPISIFTVGHELDACPNDFDFPDNIQQTLPIFFDPGLDWSSEISKYQHYLNYDLWVCHSASGNDDEILGTIKEFYDPPGYGVGPHEVKSSNGDFTLRYTISKGDACNASIC